MTTWDLEIPITFKPFWRGHVPVDKPDITIDFKGKDEDQQFKEIELKMRRVKVGDLVRSVPEDNK